MKFDQKVVTELPLKELWNQSGVLEGWSKGLIGIQVLLELLGTSAFQFVVAETGKKLIWVEDNLYAFWKNEVKIRLYSEGKPYLDDYPGAYFYFAYEWELSDGKKVVVLEKNH